jgi:hypothetical protein
VIQIRGLVKIGHEEPQFYQMSYLDTELVSGAYTNTTKDGSEDQLRFFMQESGVAKDEINQLFANVNRAR